MSGPFLDDYPDLFEPRRRRQSRLSTSDDSLSKLEGVDNDTSTAPSAPARFEPTRWSIILASAQTQAPGARSALAELCKTYWQPLYSFARRRGYDHHRSQDLIQGFFLSLIESKSLSRVDPLKGKFRSYLLASLQNHMASEHTRENAQKRGGGLHFVSLDEDDAENKFKASTHANSLPAEMIFERDWAVAAVESSLARLEEDFVKRNKRDVFLALKPFLLGDQPQGAYERVAGELAISAGAVRTGVHRLRHEFRMQLRREVAKTVESPDQIEDEMRHLRSALAARS